MSSARRQHGFSLVELVIVVVIIGVIAAIAIPRASCGARRSGASALVMDLTVMQKGIELFAAEHGGQYPDADVVHQLTDYSDSTGNSTNTTKDTAAGIVYGPYLKKVPPLPVGSKKGAIGVFHTDDGAALPPGGARSTTAGGTTAQRRRSAQTCPAPTRTATGTRTTRTRCARSNDEHSNSEIRNSKQSQNSNVQISKRGRSSPF